MNTSDSAPDDSHWSSLAHELGLDSSSEPTPADPVPTPIEVTHDPATPHHDLPDAADEEDTMLEPALGGEPVAETGEGEEPAGEDQPDEGGKRRRRRRRRRKKGGPEGAASAAVAEGDESAEETDASEDDEPPATSDTPSHDAMRDVIANWNVPSWDELIGGLYRPGT